MAVSFLSAALMQAPHPLYHKTAKISNAGGQRKSPAYGISRAKRRLID